MTDWIGKEISHYRVVRQLGQGGMGVVYLAEDLNIGRQVVLKLLKTDLTSDPRMEERFRREARACAQVTHPNISIIYEVNRHEGMWYICMEYVEGRTLRALLRERTVLPVPEAVRLAAAAADALAAAHERGIVHRDMKPDNIMVTGTGQVKVLDFGLAVFTSQYLKPIERGQTEEEGTRLTTQGVAVGTLHYMSPEQTRGQLVTPASDVFSLAAVFYEALAGIPPFRGENSLAVMHSIAYDHPPLLSTRRPDIPPDLEQALRRALSKDPDKRHPSCRAFHQDLIRILQEVDPGAAGDMTVEPEATPDAAATEAHADVDTRAGTRRFFAQLIGRDRELRILLSHLDRATDGEGSLVLISGEAGIGKTRLVADLARRAERRGARYLQGRCLFREGALPYHPFFEAAERLIASLGLADAGAFEEHIRERMSSLIGRLPVLKSFLHVSSQETSALIVDKEHLLEGISAMFLAFARERPMVLHIDDLHWADEASLDLLLYLARNCPRSQGLIVGTFRPEELTGKGGPAHPLAGILGRMSAGDLYEEIKVGRLRREETAALVSSALQGARVEPEFLKKLHDETAGNPFYVLETLKLLTEDGTLRKERDTWVLAQSIERVRIPGRVHDVVTRRLANLPSADREILEIAATEGMVFHSDTIASCLELRKIQVLSALQRAEKEHRLIHAEEDRYTFDHPLVREVLCEAVIPELRREYHRLIGRFLSENRKGKPGEEATIAYQYFEAGQEDSALPFILDAGKQARHLYANAEALKWLDRAETILTRLGDEARAKGVPAENVTAGSLRLYKERGRVHQRLGDHERAMSDFMAMQRIAASAGLLDRQAHALSLMADLCYAMGDYDRAFGKARESQALALQIDDKHSLANSHRVMGVIHYFRGEFEEALDAHNRSIDLQREVNDLAGYAESLKWVGNVHLSRGDRAKAESVYSTALDLARESGNRLAEAESLNNLGLVHYYGGEAEPALEYFEQCLSLKRGIGDKRSLARSLNNLALVYEMRGDLEAAIDTHRESLAIQREIGDQGSLLGALNNLANVYEKMGRYGEALEACEESLRISETIGDHSLTPSVLNSLGQIRLWLNQPEEAAGLFERALKMTRDQGQRLEECHSLQNLGSVTAECGSIDEALSLLNQARDLARDLDAGERESEILHGMGRLHARRGDAGATASCARDLAGLADRLHLREVDIRRLHLAARAALLGPPESRCQASRLLGEAAELASQVGLKELEWRVRRDLAEALGPGPEAEAEIARAAAIVREIGDRTGSRELSARYLAAEPRREVLERAGKAGAPSVDPAEGGQKS